MSFTKTFNHPLHMVNYMRRLLVNSLGSYEPVPVLKKSVPVLHKDLNYYFLLETRPHEVSNSMLYALLFFAEDGEIIFSVRSSMPCSLWRYRRQGVAATATMIEGVVRSHCRRNNVPLVHEHPFFRENSGIYKANISWLNYQLLKA